MSQFFDESGPELRELFFETAQELLQSLNEQALKLEKEPGDAETIRELRRIVHTLKGDAAVTGFRELSELAHELEDALALDVPAGNQSLPEVALAAADTFAAMLEAYRNGSGLPMATSLREMVKALTTAGQAHQEAGVPDQGATWTEYEWLTVQEAAKHGQHVYHVRASMDPGCAMPIAARQLALRALAEAGEVLAIRPESESSAADLHVLFASRKTSDEIVKRCRIPAAISQAIVETLVKASSNAIGKSASPAAAGHQATKRASAAPPSKPQTLPPQEHDNHGQDSHVHAENILRVEAQRIDALLNLVGELIIGKSMLQQALNEFPSQLQRDPIRLRFADAMAFQARALSELQRAVMKVRMVPAEQLFRRFPRMVRDTAKQCGRDAEVVLQGQDTDLDKGLLDAVAEPLTHLVRNAVGHGIEPPEERVRNGKPAQGTICLNAYHQGNQVVVEISDDGRGIDTGKIKMCAVERGLLTAEAAAQMSEPEALQLVFRPGFSTAEEITELSGRGVGLDVVASVLGRLKGTVEVETDAGKGTRFRLRLPLTLAIIQAMLFRVQRQLYAVPLNTVAEIARGKESDLHRVDGREILQLREHALPIIRLGHSARGPAQQGNGKIFVLVVALGERRFGLLVDALAGEEELVIKPLDDQTVDTDLVSGASILGDGRVVLILNLPAVIDRFAKSPPAASDGQGCEVLLSPSTRTQTASAGEVRR